MQPIKFKLTTETKMAFNGETLYRIEATQDIPERNVKKGDKGGWVSSTHLLDGRARISDTAWVYDNAWVYGTARVYGDALVYDNAQVFGNALVCDNARVFENARVYGDAWVYGDAQVYDSAQVYDNARVSGNAQVYDNAVIYGTARVYGNAWVYGNARVSGNAQVCDNARVSGEVHVDSASAIVSITIPMKYSITVTRKHVQIGCQLFRRSEILKVTAEKAKVHGFTKEEFAFYRAFIKAGMKAISGKSK